MKLRSVHPGKARAHDYIRSGDARPDAETLPYGCQPAQCLAKPRRDLFYLLPNLVHALLERDDDLLGSDFLWCLLHTLTYLPQLPCGGPLARRSPPDCYLYDNDRK